jgi:hypothetical protein
MIALMADDNRGGGQTTAARDRAQNCCLAFFLWDNWTNHSQC